ncbi:MAG: hypothetical protein LQ340_001070 [Diploschistes diacapsis]|nr:MAG: hypothetical protein LQ340_001070 [Diploschistes diacapsis]
MSQSLFSVSLYETLGPTAVEYIANHASLGCIATSLPHIASLLELQPRLPHLKVIISLDPLDAGEQPGYSKKDVLSAIAKDRGLTLVSIEQVEQLAESLGPIKFNAPMPSDLITINYTSGTTGNPKGVLLTHRAAVATAASILGTSELKSSDVGLSYLPLAHIYGRMLEQGLLMAGGSIGYFHGDTIALLDDLKLLRPTLFNSVPRLWNRIGGAIRAQTTDAVGFRGALSRHIVSTKLAALQDPESPKATNKHIVYDRIWGRKVSAAVGLDRCETMVSGSAPLDPSLHQFLRVVFGNNFLQGWGMTETYALGLGQLEGDYTVGNCGAVTLANEICLMSVPDMDYLVTDVPHPRGEMLIRGNTMFSGYYRNEEENSKSILPGGWFKTGDICSVDGKGRFKIIDRRKNVLKLAQGEYVTPERIENVYLSHLAYLQSAFVHGDSSETSLVAIFGVAPDFFATFAKKVLGKDISPTDMQAIAAACKEQRIRKEVTKELDGVGRKNKFAGYERVKACYLYVDPFTMENDLLTPT